MSGGIRSRVWLACVASLVSACGIGLAGSGAPQDDTIGSGDANAPSPEGAPRTDAAVSTDAEAGPPGSISLSASALGSPPADSDLTAEGTADWAHWGLTSAVMRKAKGGNQIGDFVMTGTNVNPIDYTFSGWPIATSWTDGPPGAVQVTSSKTHRYFVNSSDVALAFQLPASTRQRTAILYLGGYKARGRLELALDDSSGVVTSDERENTGYYFATRYEVTYTGSATTTKLLVRWKMLKVYDPTGTIILSSIALK